MKIALHLFLLLSVFFHAADGFTISLSGENEVPPTMTDVSGSAEFTLSADGESMTYELIISNPSGKEIFGQAGAHIHCGEIAENGPVLISLAAPVSGGDTSTEIVVNGTLTETDVLMIESACQKSIQGIYNYLLLTLAYVNVHSSENPAGEVRGQWEGVEVIEFDLGGQNEVPIVTTDATGRVTFKRTLDFVSGTINIANPSGVEFFGESGLHIHCGGIAENGPVVVSLSIDTNNTAPSLGIGLTLNDETPIVNTTCGSTISEIMDKLASGDAYVNAHSVDNPSGEIRGTAIEIGAVEFPLSDEFEVPPVDSSVTGLATFANASGILKWELSISNPVGDAIFGEAGAHIHCGGPEDNGPVTAFLVAPFDGGNTNTSIVVTGVLGDADVTDELCGATIDELTSSIFKGIAYVNVHSTTFSSGTARGQVGVESAPTFAPTSAPSSAPAMTSASPNVLTPGALSVSCLVAVLATLSSM